MIAQDAYPALEVDHYLGEIERMALRLRAQLPQDAGAEDRVVTLNQFLFGELGFRGNAEDYYDPRNSYLNEVIDRRTGIPITLSVLYMEVGRRIGLPLQGVSFPGHFLVRLRLRGGTLVLDPFSGGAPQSEAELRERLQRVIPPQVADAVPAADLPLEPFLGPCRVVKVPPAALVEPRHLDGLELGNPPRLLLKTESVRDRRTFPERFTAISPQLAALLAEQRVVLVGVDTPSVDPFDSKTLDAHHALARGGVAILGSPRATRRSFAGSPWAIWPTSSPTRSRLSAMLTRSSAVARTATTTDRRARP